MKLIYTQDGCCYAVDETVEVQSGITAYDTKRQVIFVVDKMGERWYKGGKSPADAPFPNEEAIKIIGQHCDNKTLLPDIPLFSFEEDVEPMAEKYVDDNFGQDPSMRSGGIFGFIAGYSAAKAKKYTEEDRIDAYKEGAMDMMEADDDTTVNQLFDLKWEDYIESLRPTEIEFEETQVNIFIPNEEPIYEPKVIDKAGQKWLVRKSVK